MSKQEEKLNMKSRSMDFDRKKPAKTGENQISSPQRLLPRMIRNGLTCLVLGVLTSVVIFQMNWPVGYYFLPVVLALYALIMLISAWNIRQGLVHSRMIKMIISLMNKA